MRQKKSTVSNWLIPNKVLESAELEHKPSRSEGITVYGQRSDGREEHGRNIHSVLQYKPYLLIDNDADLTISIPIIVINDCYLKQIIENEHGVGQTIVEGFVHTTNLILPTRRFVIIGYGMCGRGLLHSASQLRKYRAKVAS
ncbi:hypothetical protein [Paenibacillus sp. V4I5]|uniref:hypothetical protein n=2 Tax=unclassified Paenibacillus TaxID=185978 RepID=UPI0027D889F6|nr:hypothetical protein [Paenibacillus sp. V4I5]